MTEAAKDEKLEFIVQFLDDYLDIEHHPDYSNAHNGLQVEGTRPVRRISVAVDASRDTITAAVEADSDLLIVHHGLYWDGDPVVVGRRYDRLAPLIRNGIALYSAHLPLDSHSEVGNCAIMARKLQISLEGQFGSYRDVEVGWHGTVECSRDEFRGRIESLVGSPVMMIPGGPEQIRRAGVLTGGGGSLIADAVAAGLDAYVTGEGTHHSYFDATELGVNVYYAGHYATETWGVKALGALLEDTFGIPWSFIDRPTGL